MEPTQPSRAERPVRQSSPYHPPLNRAERGPPATPTAPIPTSSTTNPEPPIFSPIPTRPRPSQSTKAVPPTTTTSIAIDPTPLNLLAEIHRDTHHASSAQPATPARPRHPCPIRQHQRQRERDRPATAQRAGRAAATTDTARTERLRASHRARRLRERRHHPPTPDLLADRLGALSTDDPGPERPRERHPPRPAPGSRRAGRARSPGSGDGGGRRGVPR